jgi:hypothetical protein
MASENSHRLEIHSDQPFHTIKTSSVWSLLQKHHIFMKNHTGPLTKMDIITAAGWVHKLHPTFTSHDMIKSLMLSIKN